MTDYIVRMRFEGTSGWLYWSKSKDYLPPDNNPAWASGMSDDDLVLFTRQHAREFVRNYLAHNTPNRLDTYLQIRPFECTSNDPRIEDFMLGQTYNWKADRPDKNVVVADTPIPEILIIVEGGVIVEIQTTLPRLFVNLVDRDQGDIGEDPVSQYELSEEHCEAGADSIHEFCGRTEQEYQIGDDEDAYNF